MKQQQHPADHLFVVSRIAHVVFTAVDKTINWISLVLFILARGDLGSIFLIGSTFVLISASFKVDVISFRILCEWNITFYTHIVSKFTIFLYCLVKALLPWRARKALVTLFWSETWRPKTQQIKNPKPKCFFFPGEKLKSQKAEVLFYLFFKTGPGAQPFIWKWLWFARQWTRKKNSFPYGRLCTKTLFETKATATWNGLLYTCTDL